jgi:5-methylcytosine-specific restriction endonuclease McrA
VSNPDSSRPRADPQTFLDELTESRRFLAEAKELVKEAERDVVAAVYRLGQATPLGARREVVNDLYWNYPDLKTNILAEAFDYNPHKLTHGIIDPYYDASLSCPTCGIPHRITSRTKLKELRSMDLDHQYPAGWKAGDCEECRARVQRQSRAEFEAELAAREQRRRWLRSMPYRDYLQSPEWQATRKWHLKYAGFRCQLCNEANTTLDVHHRTYERRGSEHHKDLIVLCRDCHAKFHDKVVAE